MGQKIHPYGFRLGIVTDWKSRWYSEKDYAKQVNEDNKVREYLRGELTRGAVSRIDIERIGDKKVQVDVHTARPGVVIGRGGSEADRLRSGLEELTGRLVKFNVIEVQSPELDATLLARSVADQLEGRVSFRRAMKRTVSTALKAGAEGVRVQASGRLGGSDMGRREWYLEGRVPLHTLRADIDFGQATARTTVGAIGIKVWVYRGDIVASGGPSREKIAAEARLATGGPAKRRRSVRSRAEAAAGEPGGRRLIEAGGGKRIVEAGGGKRNGGRRLIEAGGGKRPSTTEAAQDFAQARREAEEVADVAAARATEAAVDAVEADSVADAAAETAIAAELVAEIAEAEGVEAVEAAVGAESAAEEVGTEDAALEAVEAEEEAVEAVAVAAEVDAVADVAAEVAVEAEEAAEDAAEEAVEAIEEAVEAIAAAEGDSGTEDAADSDDAAGDGDS